MPSGKCVFNKTWCRKYAWIRESKDVSKAVCSCCRKDINIGAMGESALKSHENSEKHRKNKADKASFSIDHLFKSEKASAESENKPTATTSVSGDFTVPAPVAPIPGNPTNSSVPVTETLYDFASKNDVLKSEIMWCLQTVATHNSYKSNQNISELFKIMFPDSAIARKFTCSERKTAYMCVFGIADHFKGQLLKDIKEPFVICFDESLNKKMQEKQMDLHVRFWDVNGHVITRYLGSQFLGHATAVDMVRHFTSAVMEQLQVKGMIQISMDGPAVNWKFHDIIQEQVRQEYGHSLVNIGSCGLHVVHNAFKAGAVATEWSVSSLLSSLWYLFKDAPARKEDWKKVTECSLMPLKFVNHRWLENIPVGKGALQVWVSVDKYVRKVESKELSKPQCKSYDTVRNAVKDKLITGKIEFFCSVAAILQPFLVNYQTDKPMVPFLAADLLATMKCLMRKFIKPEVLDQANSAEKILRINLKDQDNHVPYKKIDIGLQAEERLKSAKAGDRSTLEFRMKCKDFLIGVLSKMAQKCPISFSMVRNMSSLNPKEMQRDRQVSRDRFKALVRVLLEVKRVHEGDSDAILQQYDQFLDAIPVIGSQHFLGFQQYSDRLDEFYLKYMSDPTYEKLLRVVKMLLVLSHGQATVERGFSVNKAVECENLHDQSVVAQRIICDHVRYVGGVLKVNITNQLLVSVSSARHKYEAHLEQQRKEKKTHQEQLKRKSTLDEIEEVSETSQIGPRDFVEKV